MGFGYYDRKKLLTLRIVLMGGWLLFFVLMSVLGGCTQMDVGVSEPGTEPLPGGTKCLVSFAPLRVEEGTDTRATVVPSGQLRLLVYPAGANITTEQPVADKLYDVVNGELTVTTGETALELSPGNYHFYALMPGAELKPVKGVTPSSFSHGHDIQAGLTKVAVSEGAVVTLTPLTHKAARVEFIIEKAADATYKTLGQPSCMVLYSQPVDPVAFKLDDTGGSFQVAAGLDTLRFDAFVPQELPATGFRQDRLVLPRPIADFNIAIETTMDLGDDKGMVACTVKGQITNRMFDPGRYYHFRILVKDLREGGDIMLVVTDWNRLGWDSSMGGSGQEILVGRWTGVTYNDDMGI